MRAFVLRKVPFGESDLIVHFLTEEGGRLHGFAAGGQVSQKRFGHRFHPAGLYDVTQTKRSSNPRLERLKTADLLHFHASLAEKIERFSRWVAVLEWIALDEEFEASFENLLQLRDRLSTSESAAAFCDFFVQQTASHGLAPQLDHCVVCQRSVLAAEAEFSIAHGGLSHRSCARGEKLNEKEWSQLRSSFSVELKAPVSEQNPEQECDRLALLHLRYLEEQLGKRLKAKAFLESLSTQELPHTF